MTKLFPSDPLFWALVNSERREVLFQSEFYSKNNRWSLLRIRDRKQMLIHFGYGYMREERERYLNEIKSN